VFRSDSLLPIQDKRSRVTSRTNKANVEKSLGFEISLLSVPEFHAIISEVANSIRWSVPRPQTETYWHNGRQYIVVAIGSAEHPAEFVALTVR
jgi:hypothetical protein